MTASFIYWITRLDGVRMLLGIILAPCIVAFLTFGVFFIMNLTGSIGDCDSYGNPVILKQIKRGLLFSFTLSLLFSTALVFIPNAEEATAMLVIPKITCNNDMRKEIKETVVLAKEYLKLSVKEKK